MSPISQELREKLENEQAELQDIILDDSCLRSYRTNVESLINYLTSHVVELLELSLKLDNIPLSTRAFTLLTTVNESIIHSLFISNSLVETAEKLFADQQDNIVIINRFAMITQTCCINSPDQARLRCSFIPRFLRFCQFRSVFEMFRAFLGQEDKPKDLQAFLLEENLTGILLDIISHAPDEFHDNPDDSQAQMIAALYRLIPLIKQSEVLSDSISSLEAFATISRTFAKAPLIVQNAQWTAISSIITQQNADAIIAMSDRFLGFLEDPNSTVFVPCMESIIKIIQQLATLNADFAQKLIAWNVGDKLAALILKFPKHTIAHLAITNFALATLEVNGFPQAILPPLYKVTGKSFEDGQPAELRAFGFNFQKVIKAKNRSFADFEEFESETAAKVGDLNNVVESSYGGELPQQNNDDTDELGNLTPEQLMALLRFITGNRR